MTEAQETNKNNNVYQCIADLHSKAPKIVKDQTADLKRYSYEYASLPSVLETLTPVMESVGLSYHWYTAVEGEQTIIKVRVYVISNPNSFVDAALPLDTSVDFQRVGAQLTYYSRYLLLLILGLVAEKDDDGDEQSHSNKRNKTSRRTRASHRIEHESDVDDDNDDTDDVYGAEDEDEDEEDEPPVRRSYRRSNVPTRSSRRYTRGN